MIWKSLYHEIEKHDMVVVCDFALPMKYMFELSNKIDFTWIDHHASVIEEYEAMLRKGQNRSKVCGGSARRPLN